MKWKRAKISEVCQGIYDGPHATPSVSEEGAVFLGISNITPDGHLDLSSPKYIGEKDLPKWTKRVTPQEGDIVFSYEATLNLYAIIPKGFRGCLGRRMALIRPDEEKVLGKFLYYYFFSDEWRGMIAENTVIGATVDRIPLIRFPNFPVSFPPVEKQRLIISVLSAYDDLIENNQKQIKLLEEAAQRLYKEWFVDLRFPGHENTKITDGIPEGWRMAVLSEIASVNKESISKQYPYDYVDYIDIGAVSKGQINSVTRLSTKDAPGRAKRIAFDGDVLWGMVRPNLKSYALVFHPKETSVFSTGFAILHAEKVPFSFLYCHVTQDEFVSYLINCTNGAAYPAVKPSHFENAVLLVPTDMVLSKFHSLVGQMFRQAEILEQKNQQAIEARDRLLPKLMSGEIEV